MRRDDVGVAGFFEDLPVLVFILAGTLTILISFVSVSGAIQSEEREENLGILANRSLDLIVAELLLDSPAACVNICSVCETELRNMIEEFLGGPCFAISVVMVHPELKWLSNTPVPEQLPAHACSSSRLLNGFTDDGRIGVLLVRVLVW